MEPTPPPVLPVQPEPIAATPVPSQYAEKPLMPLPAPPPLPPRPNHFRRTLFWMLGGFGLAGLLLFLALGLGLGDRLVKVTEVSVVQQTLPSETFSQLSGTVSDLAVTTGHAVGGKLQVVGDGNFTGDIIAANFSGNGASITNVNAVQLGGQNPEYYLNAGNITTGVIDTTLLPADIAFENQINIFTEANDFTGTLTRNGNTVCDDSNNCSFATSSIAFIQGGNSYGAVATLGTNDPFDLAFETAGVERLRIDTNGNVLVGTLGAAGSTAVCRNGLNQLSSCSVGGSTATLQSAYDNGNIISTTDARDIDVVLANTTTDANFDISVADGSTGFFSLTRASGVGTTDPAQLLLIDNLDVDTDGAGVDTARSVAVGIKVQAAAGGITTAVDVSDPELVTAIALGANDITGANFSVAGVTGNITSGAINGQTISSAANFTGTLATASLATLNSLGVTTTSTFTGLATFNGGLTVSTGQNLTVNGDVFDDLTGSGLTVVTGDLTVDASSSTGFFRNGGNSFGATGTLGTNDSNSLAFETNNITRLTVDTTGSISHTATLAPATTGTTTGTGVLHTVNNTVVKTAGIDTTYGGQINVTRTGATGGTINTYGLDIQAIGDTGGTSTLTGLNVNVSGADTNYAAAFLGGQVLFTDGTISAPSLARSSATNTGIYFNSNNVTGISRAGNRIVEFGTQAAFAVDLQAYSAAQGFQIISTTATNTPVYVFRNDTDTGIGHGTNADELTLYTANTERVLIDASGRVGIGDTTPDGKLDVELASTSPTGATEIGHSLTVSDTGIVTTGTDTTYGQQLTVARTGATGGTINTYGLDIQASSDTAGTGTSTLTGLNINVSGADTNYAAIIQGGNVGIGSGATAPTALFQVADTTNPISLRVSTTADTADTYSLGFGTTNGRKLTVTSEEGAFRQALVFGDAGGGGGNDTIFGIATSADSGSTFNRNFVMKQSGNIGIGVIAPTAMLQVVSYNASTVSGNGSAAVEALRVTGGKGGTTTGTTGQTGGSGGLANITAGAGGDAPVGSTNGNGGNITLQGGAPGSGLGTAGSYGNLLLQTNGGNVGIGTASPQAALHIENANGTILLRDTDHANTWEIDSHGGGELSIKRSIDSNYAIGVYGDGSTQFQNQTDSTSGFQVFDADGGIPVLSIDTLNERVGIGDATPEGVLEVDGSTTSTAADYYGILNTLAVTTASSTATDYYGIYSQLSVNPAAATTLTSELASVLAKANLGGAGATTDAYALLGQVGLSSTGNLTNAYGMRVFSPYATSTGVITNAYGVRIDSQDTGAAVGTGYGLYQEGASDINYFAGGVGVGTSTLGLAKQVNAVSNASTSLWQNGSGAIGLVNTDQTNNNYVHIFFGDEVANNVVATIDAKIIDHTNNYGELGFTTKGSGGIAQRMVIDSTGEVGIGTNNPQTLLHVSSDAGTSLMLQGASATAASTPNLSTRRSRGTVASPTVVQTGDYLFELHAHGYNDDAAGYQDGGMITIEVDGEPATGADTSDMPGRIALWTTPDGSSTAVERMRIDNAGNVGIGTSAAASILHIAQNAQTQFTIEAASAAAGDEGEIEIRRARGTLASPSIVSSGDAIATVLGKGYGGSTDGYLQAARIAFEVDGAVTANTTDMPGRITFGTTPDDGSTALERMRIDSTGKVGIGTTSLNHILNVTATTGDDGIVIRLHNATATQSPNLNFERSRGSEVSPSAVAAADELGQLIFKGYKDGAYRDSSYIMGSVDSVATNIVAGHLIFATTNASGTLAERARVSSGSVEFGKNVSSGTTTLDIGGTGTGNAVCHSGTASATDDVGLVDCTGLPSADYMEMYPMADTAETGEIVATSNDYATTSQGDRVAKLRRSSSAYQGSVIGIVSKPEDAGDFNSIGHNIAAGDNPKPVALAGRVKVKVNGENGAIAVGDPITSSSAPGVGMKATAAGRIVGTALESFDGVGSGQIMVFVENSWYAPSSQSVFIEDKLGLGKQSYVTSGGVETFSPTSSYVAVTVTGDGDLVQISEAGAKDGDILVMVNVDATPTDTVVIDNIVGQVNVGGSDLSLDSGDTLTLIYNSDLSAWVRLSNADNSP